jgi:hypothetical protein
LFDILIGNQDRHPFKWRLLFLLVNEIKFSPIYDNGVFLGFCFDDEHLRVKVLNEREMNKYTNKTKVKAGLFENKSVKAKDLITYISEHSPVKFNASIKKLVIRKGEETYE